MQMQMPAMACAVCTCCCLCIGMSFPGLTYYSAGSNVDMTQTRGIWGTYTTGDDSVKQTFQALGYDHDLPKYKSYDGCKSPTAAGGALNPLQPNRWTFVSKDTNSVDKLKDFCNASRGLYTWTFLLSFFALCANGGGMVMPMLNYVAAVLHVLTGFFAMVTFAYFAAKNYDPNDSYTLSYSFAILVIFWLVAWLTAGLSAMAAMNAGKDEAPPPSEDAGPATEEIPDGGAAVTAKV